MDFYGSAKARCHLSCAPFFFTGKGGVARRHLRIKDAVFRALLGTQRHVLQTEHCSCILSGGADGSETREEKLKDHRRVNGGGPRWPWDLGAARDVHNAFRERPRHHQRLIHRGRPWTPTHLPLYRLLFLSFYPPPPFNGRFSAFVGRPLERDGS